MLTFYIASAIAVFATIMVITRYNMIHALLYLVVSFLAIAIVFFVLGAPFIAALEVIVYAGAIVVLIIFAIMMLNLKQEAVDQEREWLTKGIYIGPSIMAAILLAEIIYMITSAEAMPMTEKMIDAKAVGMALYGPYVIAVELCGILLMAGIV